MNDTSMLNDANYDGLQAAAPIDKAG